MAANNLGQQALMGKVVVSQAGPIAALGAGEQGQILRMALIQKTFTIILPFKNGILCFAQSVDL